MDPNSAQRPVSPIPPLAFSVPLKENLKKNKTKTNQRNKKKKTSLPSVFPILQYPFIRLSGIGSCGMSLSETFCSISLTANLHCREPLVWFKASYLCFTILTGSSPLRYPAIASTHREPVGTILQDQAPTGHRWDRL